MAKAAFFPLALVVAFLGFMAAGAQAAEAKPEDCPYWVGYGPVGLSSGDTVCALNGNLGDSFDVSGGPAVSSCADILFKIIDVLYKKQGSYQWADVMEFMSKEAFSMLDPALRKMQFRESVDLRAVEANALSMVKVMPGQFVLMDIVLDTWVGPKVRFSSGWALDSVSTMPGGRKLAAASDGRKLAAAMKWKLMSVSNIFLF
ncbi:hypothetical protein KFL_000620280 [Klebsormidium nitens]|uniref:Uncharacterized protein n=1 Tax=Klebsormidium nitens TaxID=105231 RepID=A0A1Y1HQ83_KLENI|nr:hypothetical protein KFL_000620280 [Klebsormidium nitens]|eukprot:GAQ80794.1 hypothetical protein KFL_000620280 [Klebsormidium nitens]